MSNADEAHRAVREFLQSALAESEADERDPDGGSGWDVEVDARTVLRLLDSEPVRDGVGVDWEYGYNTGSTVTFMGTRAFIEEWALVRGMVVGHGDWGSRIMRRRKAGAWEVAPSE